MYYFALRQVKLMIRQMLVIGPDELKKNAKLDLLSAMKPNHFRV